MRMRTTDWDRLAASMPMDRKAARVCSQAGIVPDEPSEPRISIPARFRNSTVAAERSIPHDQRQ
jgi:hypothetical protein